MLLPKNALDCLIELGGEDIYRKLSDFFQSEHAL